MGEWILDEALLGGDEISGDDEVESFLVDHVVADIYELAQFLFLHATIIIAEIVRYFLKCTSKAKKTG